MNFKNVFRLSFLLLVLLLLGSEVQAASIVRSTLLVKNLSCVSCLEKISSELQGLPGVVGMGGDLRQGVVVVDHNASVNGENIAAVITNLGYPAKAISTGMVDEAYAMTFADRNNRSASGCGGGCNTAGGDFSGSAPESGKVESPTANTGDVVQTTMIVENLSCGACLAKINYRLRSFAGMMGMKADLGKKIVIVEHDSSLASEEIAAAISELGYPARIATSDETTGAVVPGIAANQQSASTACGSSCNGTASSWKQLYDRYFGDK